MSLLQQNSQDQDDAARGESFTRGTSHVFLASVIAGVVVTIAIVLYIWLGEKPVPAAGEVTNVVAHFMHRETSGFDAGGANMPKEVFDQVLVFAHVKLRNQTRGPLFLHQIMLNVTLPDGIHTSYVAPAADYERAFKAYPELGPLHGKALPAEVTLEAGQTLEGDILASLRIGKQDWEARKSLDYTFGFRYQDPVKITPAGPAIDQ